MGVPDGYEDLEMAPIGNKTQPRPTFDNPSYGQVATPNPDIVPVHGYEQISEGASGASNAAPHGYEDIGETSGGKTAPPPSDGYEQIKDADVKPAQSAQARAPQKYDVPRKQTTLPGQYDTPRQITQSGQCDTPRQLAQPGQYDTPRPGANAVLANPAAADPTLVGEGTLEGEWPESPYSSPTEADEWAESPYSSPTGLLPP